MCAVDEQEADAGRGCLTVVVRLLRLPSFPFGGNGKTSSNEGRGWGRLYMRE